MGDKRLKTVPQALRDLALACLGLADALQAEAGEAPRSAPAEKPARPKREAPPKLPALSDLGKVTEHSELTRTETKILTALAQAGRALSASQIGTRAGLSSNSGGFNAGLASLRAESFIVGGSASIQITSAGLEILGPFARLPEGQQLFEYWCHKVGTSGAKILGALKQRHRHRQGPATAADLGAETGLSHNSGGFNAALAKLRRLELIEGGGAGMTLSPELQHAVEITFGVFDRSTGKTVRVGRDGQVVK